MNLLVAYVIFSTFGFYQTLHVKRFRGASQLFEFVLTLSAFASLVYGVWFAIYYGWTVHWYAPIALFFSSLLVQWTWFAIEARLRIAWLGLALSLLGFVGWPLAGIWMAHAVRSAQR